ncbi:efflux pump, RND family, inner membrane protein [Syntrophotalea carbinolica DSM 2380]|uniref:Efflux pump, RND family, inner membrane protein n=1 Tax=Syntrophotalea carbinolica (strain DSM 2380 / NBRC 103641 / GraBd1) TaxID=338963 RepID=Q3A6S9_SYNC1|nr:efflux RND transporter permease subunit [Syntrophotalea carbinolica]ABA87928.1 efflux pump, RND family, inner membrane protein [Syntrophotalea carbinolica DSM 2380]
MKQAIRWMTENHVAANLLMLVFVVGGLIIGLTVQQEVFPEVALDKVQVSVSYPGAGPEEIEDGILLKIEDNLTGVDGIRRLRSQALEGFGTVTAELRTGSDADVVLQDIKTEVDRIISFPEQAEKPIVTKLLNRRQVVSVMVYGELPERSLRELAEQVQNDLLLLPDITQVDLAGVRPYEISVEIPEANLRRYNLTLDQVAQRIRQASRDIPGGTIKTRGGEILVRTKERRYTGPEYEPITILTAADGTEVRLGDIATVRDTFRETDEELLFDGWPAAMVQVFRVGDQKPTDISETVRHYVQRKQQELPAAVRLAIWNDDSEIFQSRMNLLKKNACFGLLLVLIVLGLFLEVRLALWVMLGVPISFLGSLFFMPAVGASINMISMFAFIMALGILVDDAIVVGENVFEHRQRGKPYLKAAMDGAMEVSVPIIFAILTSVAAFSPLLFISGTMGKFIRAIPSVVILLFLVSLVESLFVLPAHLAIGQPRAVQGRILTAIEGVRKKFGHRLQRFIDGPYGRTLRLALHYRYATVASALAVLMLCLGLVGGGIIKFRFMPKVEGDIILVNLEMAPGTPVSRTREVAQTILAHGREAIAVFDRQLPEGETILRNMYSLVGSSLNTGGPEGESTTGGSHLSTIAVFLTPSEQRDIGAAQVATAWRERVGEVPGAESLVFTTDLVQLGANIDIQLAHESFDVLQQVSEQVKVLLAEYPGVEDIVSNYVRGKRELKIRLKPEARTLGITETDLGNQLRAAFYGAEALRLQRGRNEVRVMVRYPEADRQHLADLENLRVRTADGGEVPLMRAAEVAGGHGFSSINRTDRKRVINVSANVDSQRGNAEEIRRHLQQTALPALMAQYPGLSYDMEGEARELNEVKGSMGRGYVLALFGIFALLAIPFRSYSQPLLIMVAIPFGIVGAVFGHVLMGYNLSIMSVFGIVALSGVVVNDSLLLIDYVNVRRRKGDTLQAALLEAGRRRFRPILLTSLTTFFGLMPMILETSMQAKFLIPMAISLGFGIMFATGITLLLIPALYLVLEDIRRLLGLRPDHANHRLS